MIVWFNQNQGFALVCLTAIYVIATLVIVGVMLRSNRLARQNIDQTVDLDKERSRPFVLFDIEIGNHMVHAVVKNMGLTPACNISIHVSPTLTIRNGDKIPSGLLRSPIRFIAPGRAASDFIDTGPEFIKRYPEMVFNIDLSYSNLRGVKYTESYLIGLSYHKSVSYIIHRDIGSELEKINSHLDKLVRAVSI